MLAITKRHLYLPAAVLVLSAVVLALLPTVAEAKEPAKTPDARGAERVVVRPGDSLWSISSDLLGPNASTREIAEETERIHALNRARIGADPDLILAGLELFVPPAMSGRGSAPPAGVGAKQGAAEQGAAEQAGTKRAGAEQDRAKRAGAWGNDPLRGYRGRDSLEGYAGNDVLHGGPAGDRPHEDYGRSSAEEDVIRAFPGGDDIVHAEDGDGADTVDCGDGTDKAWVDAALDPSTGEAKPIDTVSGNCETVVEVVVPPNQARAEGASAGDGKARPDAARSPAASVWSDVRSTYSSAVTVLGDYSLAELRANVDRRQLGIGIIALTFLVAVVMAWKLPMKRNIGDAAVWGIPSGHHGSYAYSEPLDSYGHVLQAPTEAPDSRGDALKMPVMASAPEQDTGGLDSGAATTENRLAGAGVIRAVTGRRKHVKRRKRPPRARSPRGGVSSGAYSREICQAVSQATLKTRSPRSARRRAGEPWRGTLAMEAVPNGHLGAAWLASETSVPSANGESIPDQRLLLLSARQWETLELAAEGLPNAQIARRLFITESTVKQHLHKAYRALGIRNRREATSLFGRDGQAVGHSAQEEVRS